MIPRSTDSFRLQVKQEVHAELERALWNDTAFLSGLGVMDYSLLVGVHKASNTLVVGIIDFIRQVCFSDSLPFPPSAAFGEETRELTHYRSRLCLPGCQKLSSSTSDRAIINSGCVITHNP